MKGNFSRERRRMQEKTDALPGEDVPKVDVTQAQDGGIIKQIKRAGSDPGENHPHRYCPTG